jgi:hypothetical protein
MQHAASPADQTRQQTPDSGLADAIKRNAASAAF